MTGPSSETWILRDILASVGLGVINWVMDITDTDGNVVYSTPAIAVTPTLVAAIRAVLMPSTSYAVSVSCTNVFVSLSGYVLSAA